MKKPSIARTTTPRRVMRALAGVALFAVATVAIASCGGSDDGEGSEPTTATPIAAAGCATGPEQVRNISYESVAGALPRSTSLDVYRPGDTCGAPVVVWVHGGGWQTGDKSFQLADKIPLAREQGWVLAPGDTVMTPPLVSFLSGCFAA
jgi:acetyl esterase/lipase